MDKKLEIIWQLMNEFDFQFDRKFPADLICVLCKKIVIDARVSSCECRFCKKCIEQYLATDDMACPGHSDESEVEEMLNLESNISVDHVANRKITKLRMKCPIEMCSYMDQMINLGDHVSLCRKLAVKCPYSHVGCNYISLEGERISDHVNKEKDDHSKLMISLIEDLKLRIETVESENESMMEESAATQMLAEKMQARLDEKDIELNRRINEIAQLNEARCQWKDKQNEAKELKYQLGVFLDENEREFTWKIDNYVQMKGTYVQPLDPPASTTLFGNEGKLSTRSSKLPNSSVLFGKIEPDLTMAKQYQFGSKVDSSPPTKAILRTIYSNEFSIHPDGSKMQLYSYYKKWAYHVCAKIVTGNRNPHRPWPIKCNMTLGIMNGTNEQYFLSMNKTFEYTALDEPCGSFDFPDSLMDNIPTRDITVKCSVKVLY